MKANCTRDVWVYVEQQEGTPCLVGLELLFAAGEIATKNGGKVVAVLVGKDNGACSKQASKYGADCVISVEGAEYADYNTDAYTHALCTLADKHKPFAFLIGATDNGRDLAPRVAARLKTGLCADCISLYVQQETGKIEFVAPAFSGNLLATILCPVQVPQMGTVRPGVFARQEQRKQENIVHETIPFLQNKMRVRLLESIPKDDVASEVSDAEIVVAGGRGMGGKEEFALLFELARELGGGVASSRPPVEFGWMPHACMVGQTGKTIGPKLYIACGISGATQHCSGILGAEMVIAINKDKNAPIFDVADWGIVGDIQEVIPLLIEELKKAKSGV